MIDWAQIVNDYFSEQPHPQAPDLTIGEYPIAVKLATKLKFGGHASAHEATAFWHEFKGLNTRLQSQGKEPLAPQEFEHLVDHLSKVSFTYHGRPPSMSEIARFRDAEPSTISKYYGDLPDEHYPHVTAAQMVKYLTLAEPYARQHLDRSPLKLEAARFHHGGFAAQGIESYYKMMSGGDQPQGAEANWQAPDHFRPGRGLGGGPQDPGNLRDPRPPFDPERWYGQPQPEPGSQAPPKDPDAESK